MPYKTFITDISEFYYLRKALSISNAFSSITLACAKLLFVIEL